MNRPHTWSKIYVHTHTHLAWNILLLGLLSTCGLLKQRGEVTAPWEVI